jgi:nucleoside-diphosphate-sugar epimerase
VKKATVPGGNGYAGFVVVRHRLEAGYDVHATSNKNDRLLKGRQAESTSWQTGRGSSTGHKFFAERYLSSRSRYDAWII